MYVYRSRLPFRSRSTVASISNGTRRNGRDGLRTRVCGQRSAVSRQPRRSRRIVEWLMDGNARVRWRDPVVTSNGLIRTVRIDHVLILAPSSAESVRASTVQQKANQRPN